MGINRHGALVDANDGKTDGPRPAETRADLHFISLRVCGGGGHLSTLLAGSGVGEEECVCLRARPLTHDTLLASSSPAACHERQAAAAAASRGGKHPAPPTLRT